MEGYVLGDEADGTADCSGLYQLSDGILYPCQLATDLPYQKVEFVASDGVTLRGWYFPSGRGAAVILGSGWKMLCVSRPLSGLLTGRRTGDYPTRLLEFFDRYLIPAT